MERDRKKKKRKWEGKEKKGRETRVGKKKGKGREDLVHPKCAKRYGP